MDDPVRDPSDPKRSRRVEALFAAALERPPKERQAFLDEACSEAPEVRAEVMSLLAAYDLSDAFEAIDVERARALLEASGEPLAAERRIGPYRLIRELGRGGMGAVYLAERADGQFEHQVALKQVKPGMDSEAILRRFLAERQILARLRHDNIARLLDGGVTEEQRPYFAMEYVEGVPIATYCDERRLGVRERLRLFRQVCDAVHYAHRNLIVHRDLKPSNVLVTDEGIVKLLDFGIAKLLDDEAATATTTLSGLRAMTPEYAAPEQVRGDPVTTATDVYALGIVLYELLTGHSPYQLDRLDAEEMAEVIYEAEPLLPSVAACRVEEIPRKDGTKDTITPQAVGEARGTQPERLRRQLAGDLDTVVLKALRKEPERRYASAEALAEDVERHLAGLPVRARPDTLSYRTGKFVRRHAVAVTAAALVMLSLALGLAATVWQARKAALEAARAVAVKDFVLDLFRAADPDRAKGEEPTARELLDRGKERVESELAGEPALQAEMLAVLGGVHRELGHFVDAQALYERALVLRRRIHGEIHPEVANVVRALASVHRGKGDFDAAEAGYRATLEMQRNLFGERHEIVAETLNSLGVLALDRWRTDEANAYLRQALAIYHQLSLKPEDTRLLHAKMNLANVLSVEDELEEADALYREVLTHHRAALGDENTEVLTALHNLGTNLTMEGNDDEAEEALRESLTGRRKLLGDDHPQVVQSLESLAFLLTHKPHPDYAESVRLLREAIAIQERNSDSDHPLTPILRLNLAIDLLEMGADAEAAEVTQQATDGLLRVGGPQGALAEAKVTLAACRYHAGASAEAEQLLAEAEAEARGKVLVGSESLLADVQHYRGRLLFDDGRVFAAEAAQREALRLNVDERGDDHPKTAAVRVWLAKVLLAQGRLDEAEPLLRAADRVLAEVDGGGPGVTRSARAALAARAELDAARRRAQGAPIPGDPRSERD